jgi:hypothetical protein
MYIEKRSIGVFDQHGSQAGLPDGLFSNPKSQFGQILEVLR